MADGKQDEYESYREGSHSRRRCRRHESFVVRDGDRGGRYTILDWLDAGLASVEGMGCSL